MEESMRKLTDLSRKGEKYTKATLTAAELSDTLQRLSKNGQLNYNIPPFNQKNPNLDQQDQSTMTIMATNICNSLLSPAAAFTALICAPAASIIICSLSIL